MWPGSQALSFAHILFQITPEAYRQVAGGFNHRYT